MATKPRKKAAAKKKKALTVSHVVTGMKAAKNGEMLLVLKSTARGPVNKPIFIKPNDPKRREKLSKLFDLPETPKPVYNLNAFVRFQLTEKGQAILQHSDHAKDSEAIPDGTYYRMSLWVFAAIFGKHFYNGSPQLIVGNVIEFNEVVKFKMS